MSQRIIYLILKVLGSIEVDMLLKAKLTFMSGIAIGSAAVMVMKQVCKRKRRKKHQETGASTAASD